MNSEKETKEIIIGKFTLDSLTTGMYEDSRVIYREYVQNSTDSIDEAIKLGILSSKDEGVIDVNIDADNQIIKIRDNGVGVESENAWNSLCDIGNSKKKYIEHRGFRGIGRLGGLSYCEKLSFVTSAKGEKIKSIVQWDCVKLKELLTPGKYADLELRDVIKKVTTVKIEDEELGEHYFEVVLEGVKMSSNLLNVKDITDYLSQVSPIPFDGVKFPYYSAEKDGIKIKLNEINKPLEEYRIFINGDPNELMKPYKTWFKTGNRDSKSENDDILGVKYIEEYDENENLIYFGWYGECNFYGTVKEDNIAGIRLRKNNIQIGDFNTCNKFFKEDRFNKWFIGEVYIYDKNVIPNARRDNFEENEASARLRHLLKRQFHEMSKIPQVFSEMNSASKKIERSSEELNKIKTTLDSGITSKEERKTLVEQRVEIEKTIGVNEKKLKNAKKKVEDLDFKVREKVINTINRTEDIKNEIKNIDDKIENPKYAFPKELSGLSRENRNIVFKIFEVLDKEVVDKEFCKKLKQKIVQTVKR